MNIAYFIEYWLRLGYVILFETHFCPHQNMHLYRVLVSYAFILLVMIYASHAASWSINQAQNNELWILLKSVLSPAIYWGCWQNCYSG